MCWSCILSVTAYVLYQPTHRILKFPLTCICAQGDPPIDSNLSSLGDVCVFWWLVCVSVYVCVCEKDTTCVYACIFEPIPLHASLKATSLE